MKPYLLLTLLALVASQAVARFVEPDPAAGSRAAQAWSHIESAGFAVCRPALPCPEAARLERARAIRGFPSDERGGA